MSRGLAKKRATVFLCVGIVAAMGGLAAASVPLYELYCRVTGFGGTPRVADVAPNGSTLAQVQIRFDANVDPALDWRFKPESNYRMLTVGQSQRFDYIVQNNGRRANTGTAIFNVLPEWTAQYFYKIECFCFTAQELAAGEKRRMPVEFYLDEEILDNPAFSGLDAITLSYTMMQQREEARAVP